MTEKESQQRSVLGDMAPNKAIVKLAVPATLALLAKAIYNLVDTAYIGMLNNDLAMAGVGVTVPLLLIMVSIENIFAAGPPFWRAASWGPRTRREPAARSPPLWGSPSSSARPCVWAVSPSWSR